MKQQNYAERQGLTKSGSVIGEQVDVVHQKNQLRAAKHDGDEEQKDEVVARRRYIGDILEASRTNNSSGNTPKGIRMSVVQ